jgi:hypothetical protein
MRIGVERAAAGFGRCGENCVDMALRMAQAQHVRIGLGRLDARQRLELGRG